MSYGSQRHNSNSYTLVFHIISESAVSINILSKKEHNLEKQESAQEYPLIDKAYYVDTIGFKIDNSVECLNESD